MSFLAPAQRGYESMAHSDISHIPRVQMNTLPSFDNLPSPPTQQVYHSTVNHRPSNGSSSSDRSHTSLPKLGQTRCYWSLLSPDLHFLYLDPVLASHLGEQADLLLGKSLLEFVHPDEQASADHDLGGVLKSRTLHGSVTRVRYSRLSRVRRQLGFQGLVEDWPEASKIAVDSNYMAVDIVINWAADGLVLCFMHAVVDLTARDNDENNKTGWTNWCGTPYMSVEQVQLMYQQLVNRVPQPASMTRVFQVLLNQSDRPLWLSWPPDPSQGHGPTSKDFARLAEDVQIGNSVVTGTDAKTSCTRRYKALQPMHLGRSHQTPHSPPPYEVESIFIPYGSIIFACHRVNMQSSNGREADGTQPNHYATPYNQSIPSGYITPSHSDYASNTSSYPPQLSPPQPHYPTPHWTPTSGSVPQQSYDQWSQETSVTSAPSISNVRSSGYTSSHPPNQWSAQPPYHLDTSSPTPFSSYPTPSGMPYPGSTQSANTVGAGQPSPVNDTVPPSRIPRRGAGNRDNYGNGGRGAGNPPTGVNRCASCKATHSPEWRKGPSGKKDLCNACGLRFARSRAKKEGNPQRRRKERMVGNLGGRSEHPAPSTGLPYQALRRSYDENSFSGNPGSGSEAFSHAAAFTAFTPSPSPPAGSTFSSYAHAPHVQRMQPPQSTEPRAPYTNPLSSPTSYYSTEESTGIHHTLSGVSAPRLDPPPLGSSNSPPLSSPVHPFVHSSYERETKRESDQDRILLPPTPDERPRSRMDYLA